jgi:hypothetical protein
MIMAHTRPACRVRRIGGVAAAAMWVNACATGFQAPETAQDERAYASIYPYFAEYCAASEFSKKKGIGVDIEGQGPGGHSVFYLNGVCRVRDVGYPELVRCADSPDEMAGKGVGLSVNAHYQNANWVATEGRDFFYRGDLAPGEGVNRASYARTVEKAKAFGILDGVVFHRTVFDDKPVGMSDRDYMYEVSIATDYAIGFGRDRYCARVPLDSGRMDLVVRYLNGLNEPYRSGRMEFNWHVLQDNCTYLAHNALAAAGLWPELPIDRPLLIAAFDFPVPKNEFVNMMRITNDMPVTDPDAMYDDKAARSALLRQQWIATQAGALAEAVPVVQPNDAYDSNLRLIFFDEPVFGHYQERFNRIFSEPRYTDLAANLTHFSALYTAVLDNRSPVPTTEDRAAFFERYYDTIIREKAKVDAARAQLTAIAGDLNGAHALAAKQPALRTQRAAPRTR